MEKNRKSKRSKGRSQDNCHHEEQSHVRSKDRHHQPLKYYVAGPVRVSGTEENKEKKDKSSKHI